PGHIKHRQGDTFAQVYLSYLEQPIPAESFKEDFGPDAKYLYLRQQGKVPARLIRAYQVKVDGKAGPWLAGMAVDPGGVSEAWCQQGGYVWFIEELHRKKVKAGDRFGAGYVGGWFGGVAEMEKVYDRYKGKRAIVIEGEKFRLE